MSEPSKILLANYPKLNQSASFQRLGGTERIDVISGYDLKVDNKSVTLQILNDMAMAILTYDQVLLLGNNVIDVIKVWGTDALKALLREGIVKVIPDVELNPVLKKGVNGGWSPGFFGYSSGGIEAKTHEQVNFNHKFGNVEYWLFRSRLPQVEIGSLMYLIDDNESELSAKDLTQKIYEETDKDMSRAEFLDDPEFCRINNGRVEFNTVNELRLHNLNTLLSVAYAKNVDGLKTDGAICNLMNKKMSAAMNSVSSTTGVDSLRCIMSQKGFPDIGPLLLNGTMNIGDLLKLRNDLNGKLFRYWARQDNYEEMDMRRDIMNSAQKIIPHPIRTIACSIAGLAGTIPGLVASMLDSTIMEKVAKGWHPNLFLDNELKSLIDKKVLEENKKAKLSELNARFAGVNRNDPCPCGSGLKFKNCHGKGI